MLIRKVILFVAIIGLLTIPGCSEDEFAGGGTRWCEVEASFEETLTRVGLSTMENSRNLVAQWQEGDQINVILCANDKYYEVGPVPVREISNDGRSCKFSYRLPENFKEPSDGYQLMCFTSNCQPKIIDNEVYYNGSLIRRPISQFKASVMSDEHASSGMFQSNFRHYYTYELLHISNKSDKDIDFALCAYSADLIWYRTLCAVRNWDGRAVYPSEAAQAAIEESPTVKIPANGSDIIVSAYIPNGQLIKNAKMTAKINGEHVHTSNLLSSNKELERGHAYHMYATWDGTELKFDNVDDNSFHLSANSISLYVNTDSPVTIFNGSGEYDVINENPDIVDYDINGVHVAHAPSRYYDMGGGHGEPIEGDLWWITAKKIGDATLKLIDKQTTKELILKVTVTQAPSLTLAQSNVEMNVGETKHVEILTGSQWYEVSTDNNGVVSVSKATISTGGGGRRGESGSSYTGIYAIIEALSAGEAVVTVKDLSSGETADINVKVSSSGDYPVAEAIDLGLPSGTLWASWNVGASKPEEYGGYYAWGETEEKDYYDWSTYTLCDGSYSTCHHIGDDIAGTEYDVAHVKWGGSWYMPSINQIKELRDNCTQTWTKQNGVYGIRVTGPNGNTIFIPAAGYRTRDSLYGEGENGACWSSSLYSNYSYSAYGLLNFLNEYWDWSYYDRSIGYSVRAVISPEKPQDCPVAEAIDLGLPSGTKWASWNVGASAPEEYGGYYAWGETEEKDYYDWSTYKWCKGEYDSMTKYCTDGSYGYTDNLTELLPEDDAATANWGMPWHMPTLAQLDELRQNCSREWTQLNGVNGILITGPNGNTIFLPAGGFFEEGIFYGEGSYCSNWSSSLYWWGFSNDACVLSFSTDGFIGGFFDLRKCGKTVRAVIGPEKPQNQSSCTDSHHPHMIDLGLPSGTKWACCNVEATTPEEYGGYYAWGETEEKDVYDWSTYTHCDGSSSTCHYIGDDIAGTEYDVAHVKWGSEWRMPSFDQIQELSDNCTRTFTQQNGVNGQLVIGPNGAAIFLPNAGNHNKWYKSVDCWSSSQSPYYKDDAFVLGASPFDWTLGSDRRFGGKPVRPVSP